MRPQAGPNNTAGANAGSGGRGVVPPGPDAVDCSAPRPGPAPLRRLTRFEFNNTVRDVFGETNQPGNLLPPEPSSYEDAQLLPSQTAEVYRSIARDFAEKWSKDSDSLRTFLGCDPSVAGEVTCKGQLFDTLLPRAFRRPLSPDDLAEMEAVFASGEELGGDFASGVRAVFDVLLQSPEFLYKIEVGEPAASTASDYVDLTPYEVATRLSYFIWGSTPDPELFAAAAKGGLREPAELEAQARRLLTDARARAGLRHFYRRLFQLNHAPREASSDIPEFTAEVALGIVEQTELFLDDVTWQGQGTFRALLTEPSTWANNALGSFYGLPGVNSEGFQKVSLDPARGGGILVQPGVIASRYSSSFTHPAERGAFILKQLLCLQLPPPPDAIASVPSDAGLPESATTRQRFEYATKDTVCMACHIDLNPVGFAFENYDALGRYRATEHGIQIDSSGELLATDARGKFSGPAELVQRIADSEDAHECFIDNWVSFAHARQAAADDACARERLKATFAETDGNVLELVVALSQTDNFRYRRVSEIVP